MSRTAAYDFEALQHDPEAVLSRMDADQVAGLLEVAADAYYNRGTPLISDDLYDLVFDHLKAKAPRHPAVQRIGAPIAAGDKVQLPYWMGSLDKIRDDPKALTKWAHEYSDPAEYLISDKLDGNSGLLLYTKKGISLYSRGDGTQGQDVSHLLPHIQGVVSRDALAKQRAPIPLAVRGELIISRKNWDTIRDLGANARNVVAGAMHRKTADTRIAPKIDFVAYELLDPPMPPSEGLNLLGSLGFKTVHFETVGPQRMTMDALSEALVRRRRDSPYEIDGIVIFHNKQYKRIRGKNPKYAFAFKSLLTHDEAEVVVTKVEWNVSKDGYLKPLVHFPPVTLEGAKIGKATGFNAAFITQHNIGPGSRIVVIRSGAVIPHIVRIVSPSSNGRPAMPDTPFVWNETRVDITLPQGDSSAAMRMKQMEYFANTLDLKYLGPGTIKKLFEAGTDTIPKLLALKAEDIQKIEGFQSTSAKNIVESLGAVQSARCADLMAASGLFGRGMGAKKLAPVLEAFPSLSEPDVSLPSYEELRNVPGMGEVSARAVLEGIAPFRRFLQEIHIPCNRKARTPSRPSPAGPSQPGPSRATPAPDMTGITAVFTGFRNKEWEDKIAAAHGKVSTSVSKNTTFVVAADVNDDSTKSKKARELNIPILSKDEFASRYGL